MIGSIAAELFVLRKRASTWILVGIWITLAAFFTYILPYVTYRGDAGEPRREPLEPLLPEAMVGSLSGGFPFFGGAIVLMLGVMSLGSDYGWGTLKTLLVQRPGRMTVFGAKLAALGIVLVPFVILVFLVGAIASAVIAGQEGAAMEWPSVWQVVRGMLAGWVILAVWTCLGVMLAVLTRGTSLAIGIGILYALVVEGLLSAIAGVVEVLEPLVEFFLRANAYSLVAEVGASVEAAADNGPGAFNGPYVGWVQAVLTLAVYLGAFVAVSAWSLWRRDVV